AGGAAASTPIELHWDDLIPEAQKGLAFQTLQGLGVVEHGQLSTPFDQEAAYAVVTEYDGEVVRIPGYVVPLDFEGIAITDFILVPYIGACIHVPPPPANQLIFVRPAEPFEIRSMWDPVFVTGTISALAFETALAQIGYGMEQGEVAPYF
ncbi:MAG: DUF3299 domain-containing protein, partial [Pseudomonadota bacterium]